MKINKKNSGSKSLIFATPVKKKTDQFLMFNSHIVFIFILYILKKENIVDRNFYITDGFISFVFYQKLSFLKKTSNKKKIENE